VLSQPSRRITLFCWDAFAMKVSPSSGKVITVLTVRRNNTTRKPFRARTPAGHNVAAKSVIARTPAEIETSHTNSPATAQVPHATAAEIEAAQQAIATVDRRPTDRATS
jgi:HAMP domain-containing protein